MRCAFDEVAASAPAAGALYWGATEVEDAFAGVAANFDGGEVVTRVSLQKMHDGEPASQLEVEAIGREEHGVTALMSKTEVLLAVEVDARGSPRSAPS